MYMDINNTIVKILNRFSKLPSVHNRNDTRLVQSDSLIDRLRKIEMVIRRVTCTTRRTKVSGSDHNGPAFNAPLRIVDTHQLETCTAAKSLIE